MRNLSCFVCWFNTLLMGIPSRMGNDAEGVKFVNFLFFLLKYISCFLVSSILSAFPSYFFSLHSMGKLRLCFKTMVSVTSRQLTNEQGHSEWVGSQWEQTESQCAVEPLVIIVKKQVTPCLYVKFRCLISKKSVLR